MPREQIGSPFRVKGGYGVRWRENGSRQHFTPSPPFLTKTAAHQWFAEEIRPRIRGIGPTTKATLAMFTNDYVGSLVPVRDRATVETLRVRLGVAGKRSRSRTYDRPIERFGDVPLRELEDCVSEIAAWRTTLPEGMRYGIVRAFSQVCNAAMDWGYLSTNPVANSGPNPQPRRTELLVFEDDAEIDRLADEFATGEVSRDLIVVLAETGLRTEEALGLDRRHVDHVGRVAAVEQVFVNGNLKPVPKTDRSRRIVPLTRRALAALVALPVRLDTLALFPGPESARLNLHNWRSRDWEPALESAGFFDCLHDRSMRRNG